ncbi:MAG: hypothetical protein IPJ52_03330 [Rhodocyclaceae bacterium]|nr:hypothetical protein [Rhodocyclaceae bacterium]MBK6553986.1 hypothetical protein [Rhodocyclaceae bacterium]MBK6678057.1 hypothetical protein [Rhodocyclaceae bacterium]MBK7813399.1 hypothetical protein [Rhodocyclaceae bacterium]MBK9310735.1 hypothetical protein [Rhodocyclaceae bacterium]
MKLLIDNQLPEALARFLAAQGLDTRHVRRQALIEAFARILDDLRTELTRGTAVIEIN